MKRHARKAFDVLKKLGAPVYDRQEHDAHFILGGELRDSEDTYFADYYGEERYQLGEKISENMFGIRADVHAILTANGLFAEWINPGMVGIYDS